MSCVKSLGAEEKSEMDKFFGSLSNRINPLAPGRTEQMPMHALQERLMVDRPAALRHIWDVEVGPHFLSDYESLPTDVQECVMANISVMACSLHPAAMGEDTGTYGLMTCDIGRGYHIIYQFRPRYHRLALYFARRHNGAAGGPLRVVLPGPVPAEPGYDEAYEEVVNLSYTCDVEKEDLRNVINRMCE